jgi:hypothetical protein
MMEYMRILMNVNRRMISPAMKFPVVRAMVNKKKEYNNTGTCR